MSKWIIHQCLSVTNITFYTNRKVCQDVRYTYHRVYVINGFCPHLNVYQIIHLENHKIILYVKTVTQCILPDVHQFVSFLCYRTTVFIGPFIHWRSLCCVLVVIFSFDNQIQYGCLHTLALFRGSLNSYSSVWKIK